MEGRLSFAGISAYSATKFALKGFSEALRAEVAPSGVTVLIVDPGNFRTGLLAASGKRLNETEGRARRRRAARCP